MYMYNEMQMAKETFEKVSDCCKLLTENHQESRFFQYSPQLETQM